MTEELTLRMREIVMSETKKNISIKTCCLSIHPDGFLLPTNLFIYLALERHGLSNCSFVRNFIKGDVSIIAVKKFINYEISYCHGLAFLLGFIQMDAYWCMYLPRFLESHGLSKLQL